MSYEYVMPLMNELSAETLSLGAPVFDDVIQVGLYDTRHEPKTRLAVQVHPRELVTITREDGNDLQIQEVIYDLDTSSIIVARRPVLAKPVAELALRPARAERTWTIDGQGVIVQNYSGLGIFIGMIAAVAKDKQERNNRKMSL